MQCQTALNWSKVLWFGNHVSGGLNHQIINNCLLSICHSNFVNIQDVVDTCKEFGVP